MKTGRPPTISARAHARRSAGKQRAATPASDGGLRGRFTCAICRTIPPPPARLQQGSSADDPVRADSSPRLPQRRRRRRRRPTAAHTSRSTARARSRSASDRTFAPVPPGPAHRRRAPRHGCAARATGRAVPLRRVRKLLRRAAIPHPMYRYQRTPHEFGNVVGVPPLRRLHDVARGASGRGARARRRRSRVGPPGRVAQVGSSAGTARHGADCSLTRITHRLLPSCSCSSASRAGGRLDSTRAQVVAISCYCYCQSATGFIGTAGGSRHTTSVVLLPKNNDCELARRRRPRSPEANPNCRLPLLMVYAVQARGLRGEAMARRPRAPKEKVDAVCF